MRCAPVYGRQAETHNRKPAGRCPAGFVLRDVKASPAVQATEGCWRFAHLTKEPQTFGTPPAALKCGHLPYNVGEAWVSYNPAARAKRSLPRPPGCAWRHLPAARSTERLPTVRRTAQIPAAVGRRFSLWSLRGFFWRSQKKSLRNASQGAAPAAYIPLRLASRAARACCNMA